jgi:hypothetical protein
MAADAFIQHPESSIRYRSLAAGVLEYAQSLQSFPVASSQVTQLKNASTTMNSATVM